MRKLSELHKSDLTALAQDDRFKRFLFTVFSSAPMFTGTYGTDGRHLAYAEGRRSLGFDILRSVEIVAGPDALAQIIAAGSNAQKEYQDDVSKDDTNEELDGPRQRDRAVGLQFIDYSAEPK
ncbi:MAG: hypothetical protein ACRCWJ_15085 [Casimicrobium sp.]